MTFLRLLPRLLPRRPPALRPPILLQRIAVPPPLSRHRVRTYTTDTTEPPPGALSKRYDFAAIQSLAPDKILIDVREPGEFEAGAIPRAINLPIVSAPEALCLPEDEFEDRFGFRKPPKDAEVVFYCKAGIRSAAAAQLALQQGYSKVGEYPGSWVDWVKKTNEAASSS